MKHVEGPITRNTKLLGRKEKLLNNIKGKCLDIGCGEGELLIKATLLGHDIIGIDSSLREIEVAKKTALISGVEINIKHGYIEDLPFEKDQFDTIIMGEVIEHLPNVGETVKRVLTFLKDGGQLLITTPAGFAHADADHKNFFFKREVMEKLSKYWVFDFLPKMWLSIHRIVILDNFFDPISDDVSIEEIEYGDSKHASLDFFIKVKKRLTR